MILMLQPDKSMPQLTKYETSSTVWTSRDSVHSSSSMASGGDKLANEEVCIIKVKHIPIY
jgi:hypothetical protein